MARLIPCAVLSALLLSSCSKPQGPLVEVREIQSELLFAREAMQVVAAPAGDAPRVERMVPSADLAREKEDLSSLILAPPAEVRFELEPGRAPRFLRALAGIDRSAGGRVPAGKEVTIAFEVRLDGELAWETNLTVVGGSEEGAGWEPVGSSEEGLALGEAHELTLRTYVVAGDLPPEPLQLGFGRLTVEEVSTMNLELASPEEPNVVFVVMDTLRFDRTSSGAYSKDTTPVLARLAAEGIDWRGACSTCPWTWPSTASMLTGLLPEEHGVTGTGSSYLSSELDTLAEVMQRHGMATGAFVGNPLIVPPQNFDQGFQTFRGTRAGIFVDGDVLVPEALEWVRAQKDSRFFLYLHMVDPHVPNDPDPEVVGRFGRASAEGWSDAKSLSAYGARMMRGAAFDKEGRPRYKKFISPEHIERMQSAYDEAVWTGDKWFGVLLDELEALGLRENTLVVFTADHGEELLDHGLVKHSHSLYSELVRVPLVIAGPGVPAGGIVEEGVSNRSVFATLSAAAGGEFVGPGADLRNLGRQPEVGGAVFFSTVMGFWNGVNHLQLYGVRADGWALHFAPDGGPWGASEAERLAATGLEGKVRLFDLEQDPLERRNVAAREPERVETLLKLLRSRLAESAERATQNTMASGEGTLDMLRAIGYLDGEDE
jgi:arylsulfatase A-like enzyme